MSARVCRDALGFGSYETAWAWLHKLRRAMVRPERELLTGVVELDRFNRRTSRARGLLFYRLLQQAAGTDPHPLSELIGGTGNDWDEFMDD